MANSSPVNPAGASTVSSRSSVDRDTIQTRNNGSTFAARTSDAERGLTEVLRTRTMLGMILRVRSTSGNVTQSNISGNAPPSAVTAAVVEMMRANSIPGLSIAVVDRDRVQFAGGFGLADRESNRPATASTAYLWFSMTKIVTATAALRLVDDGRLDLDASAGEYLSGLRPRGTSLA